MHTHRCRHLCIYVCVTMCTYMQVSVETKKLWIPGKWKLQKCKTLTLHHALNVNKHNTWPGETEKRSVQNVDNEKHFKNEVASHL